MVHNNDHEHEALGGWTICECMEQSNSALMTNEVEKQALAETSVISMLEDTFKWLYLNGCSLCYEKAVL